MPGPLGNQEVREVTVILSIPQHVLKNVSQVQNI